MVQNSVLVGIFTILLTKRSVTREYLSRYFELSKRTISRYVDFLTQGGVPILSLPGVKGGYFLPDDYKIDRMLFNDSERSRIISSLKATASSFEDKMNENIIEKLSGNRQNETFIDKNFLKYSSIIIDAVSWGSPNIYKSRIETLERAIELKQSINLKYIDRGCVHSQRIFDPYNLVFKQGVWYTYGFCRFREDFRLFKVSGIKDVFITDEKFEVRADANVYEKLSAQFDVINEVVIELEFSNLILSQIEEWLGTDAIFEEGLSYKARASVYDGNELIAKILSFGSSVKVLSPPQLRQAVADECRRVLDNSL